jgi:hypothetical protein
VTQGQHAARPITPRSIIATGLAVIVVFALGLMIALPAHQAYDAKAQGQDLAGKVLVVCQQGGDAAAPLNAIGACPLARQVQSTPEAAGTPSGLTADEIQAMIREEVARQLPKTPQVITPVEGGAPSPGPSVLPGAAGLPGESPAPGPAEPPNERIQSTATEQAPPLRDQRPPSQYGYPASQRQDDRRPPERTVTERPPAPVTVTEQAPPTVTQTVQAPAPAPVTQNVNQPEQAAQPAPANQGVPLLDGVGGLLNGLGNGL